MSSIEERGIAMAAKIRAAREELAECGHHASHRRADGTCVSCDITTLETIKLTAPQRRLMWVLWAERRGDHGLYAAAGLPKGRDVSSTRNALTDRKLTVNRPAYVDFGAMVYGTHLTELGVMWINRELGNAETEAHELNPASTGEVVRRYFDLDATNFNGVVVECAADFLATLTPANGWTGAHVTEGPDAFGEVTVRVWSMSFTGEGNGNLNDYILYATVNRRDRIDMMHERELAHAEATADLCGRHGYPRVPGCPLCDMNELGGETRTDVTTRADLWRAAWLLHPNAGTVDNLIAEQHGEALGDNCQREFTAMLASGDPDRLTPGMRRAVRLYMRGNHYPIHPQVFHDDEYDAYREDALRQRRKEAVEREHWTSYKIAQMTGDQAAQATQHADWLDGHLPRTQRDGLQAMHDRDRAEARWWANMLATDRGKAVTLARLRGDVYMEELALRD